MWSKWSVKDHWNRKSFKHEKKTTTPDYITSCLTSYIRDICLIPAGNELTVEIHHDQALVLFLKHNTQSCWDLCGRQTAEKKRVFLTCVDLMNRVFAGQGKESAIIYFSCFPGLLMLLISTLLSFFFRISQYIWFESSLDFILVIPVK